ncbi:hypothetical protein CBR_g54198 [Chara braunii]|uniref:DUF659 domain-containing protein n=1 Tax=Chara braunii TaxID=69332 RepID=A0A388K7A1_CHABU|nr:hypothetical protein CBR_g54198 [Chara braunii]|eukprot:GBG65907.1 hypothetical protein CBR_g54198 [Chara braunii]
MALEQERDDEDDVPDVAGAGPAGEGGGGGIVDQPEEPRGGEGEEGLDEGTRGVVTGGSDGGGRPGSSQAVMQVARTRRPGRQMSIKRYVKNPRQEEIDNSCCEFFVRTRSRSTSLRAGASRSSCGHRSKPVFIKCEDLNEGDKESATVVAGWKRFFREWGVEKITAVCTDFFAGNTSVARMLREDPEFNQIYWIPCTAHCMDLLMHDICKKKWTTEIISKANRVVNFFRVHRWPRSTLRTTLVKFPDLKCSCLLRPTQTRFGTRYVMLQRLEVCEKAIRRIVAGAFWADVRKLTAVMKRPYDVFCEVDKDVHCLSLIYDMACRLPDFVRSAPLMAEQRDDILRDVGNRTDMLLSPIHVVARLMDPQWRDITVFIDVNLMTQFEGVVERLIGKKGSTRFDECMDQLYDFQFGRGVLGTPQAKKRATEDTAVLWWEAHGAGHPEICELAIRVLSIWTTSSPAERNWST